MQSKIDKNVFRLGLVSLFTDISSEMIYPLLPIFLSSVLGTSIAFIGVIEGIAESTASLLKVFSGWFSDKLRKRKPIILLGYGLSAITKPFFYFALNSLDILIARIIDRIGKGIRTSPRDALIADSSSPEARGKAFGIQRSMDSFGAFLGPLAAFLILPILNNNLRVLFLCAFIPAAIAVFIIIFFIKDKPITGAVSSNKTFVFSLKNLSREFKIFLFIAAIFTLGNSSNVFLILRAKDLGVNLVLIPVFWLVFNLMSSLSAIPFGHLSDKIGRKKTTILGFLIYALVYLGFAFANKQSFVWVLIGIYGIYDGLSEGVLRAYVADLVKEKEILATCYGIYHMVIGLCIFPASLIMGLLWQNFGTSIAFSFGAGLAFASALLLSLFFKNS